MKKERIYKRIENKIIIKQKSTGLLLTENMSNSRCLGLINYPAIFNSEEDALRYLKFHNISEEEMKDIIIESSNNSIFDNGGILIDYSDNFDELIEPYRVNVLKEICENHKSDKNIILSCNIRTGWTNKMQAYVTSVLVDEPHNTLYLSNSFDLDKNDRLPRLTVSELLDKISSCSNDLELVFEIYTLDLKENLNNQAVSEIIYNLLVSEDDFNLILEFNTNRPLFSAVRE